MVSFFFFFFFPGDGDEYSYYCCLEDETPLLVSEKCDVDITDLVAVNIDMLPSLQKYSKLRNGSFFSLLFHNNFTIIYLLYNIDFILTDCIEKIYTHITMKGTNLYLPLYDDPGMFLFQNLTIYFGSFSSTAVLIKYI